MSESPNVLRGKKMENACVVMDNCVLVDCELKNCTLVFDGGECSWFNCQFIHCTTILRGAAARTQNFLAAFGWKPIDGSSPAPLSKPN